MHIFILLFKDAPQLVISSPSILVAEWSPVKLRVQIDSNPFPQSVTVAGVPLGAVAPVVCLDELSASATLSFSSVNRHNIGTYTVAASNLVDSASITFTVTILRESEGTK